MNHPLLVSPMVLFRILVAMVVAIVALGVYVTLSTTGSLTSTSRNASEQAGLAQLAADLEAARQFQLRNVRLTERLGALTDMA